MSWIFPAGQDTAVRVEFFSEIERPTKIDPLTGEILDQQTNLQFSHPVTIRHASRLKKRLLELSEFNQRLK